jgi:hypothetical protein
MVDPAVGDPTFIFEWGEDDLSDDCTEFSACSRDTMCGGSITSREDFTRYNELILAGQRERSTVVVLAPKFMKNWHITNNAMKPALLSWA